MGGRHIFSRMDSESVGGGQTLVLASLLVVPRRDSIKVVTKALREVASDLPGKVEMRIESVKSRWRKLSWTEYLFRPHQTDWRKATSEPHTPQPTSQLCAQTLKTSRQKGVAARRPLVGIGAAGSELLRSTSSPSTASFSLDGIWLCVVVDIAV